MGRIVAGAHADLVVWNAALHTLAPDALATAAPALTVLGGEIVYRAATAPESAGASFARPVAATGEGA